MNPAAARDDFLCGRRSFLSSSVAAVAAAAYSAPARAEMAEEREAPRADRDPLLLTENPVIKHGDAEASLVLKVADDAALGDFTVKVGGHSAGGGVDSSNDLKLTVAQK